MGVARRAAAAVNARSALESAINRRLDWTANDSYAKLRRSSLPRTILTTLQSPTVGVDAMPWIAVAVGGALAGLLASGRLQFTPTMRTFIFVGILGGFTTFSSFGLDTLTLAHGGDHARAFWTIAG